MNKELVVFVKNPVAGKVKTRLAATIGETNALAIYLQLLNHTLDVCQKTSVPVSVYFSDFLSEDIREQYPGFSYHVQHGNDLGERMENAFKDAFKKGKTEVIIIGSDLYDLQQNILEQAFEWLSKKEVVIGPAKDGGYYLLGLKEVPNNIFKEKSWGTPAILKATLDNLIGYDVALLKELNDIDVIDDLNAHPELIHLLKDQKLW